MKWGVRRYQNSDGSLTRAGKLRYNKGTARTSNTSSAAQVFCERHKNDRVSDLNKFSSAGRKRLMVMGIDIGDNDSFNRLSQKETTSEVIHKANPTKTHNNCYNVVTAVVGRLCGLDVTAKGDTQGGKGLSFDEVCKVFKLDPSNERDVVRIASPTVERITRQIEKRYSEGDVGAIGLGWSSNYSRLRQTSTSSDKAGHTLNWVVKNGVAEFLDGQVERDHEYMTNFLKRYMDTGTEVSLAKFANVNKGLNLETDVDMELFKKFVD